MHYTETNNVSCVLSNTISSAICSELDAEHDLTHCFHDNGPIFSATTPATIGALWIKWWDLPHYFFWGNGNKAIHLATTDDLKTYQTLGDTFITSNPGSFDQDLIEPGPQPLQLDNGNWIMLYNGAKKSLLGSPKPNYDLVYGIGYVIFDQSKPPKVLFRSKVPIATPTLGWEICNGTTTGFSPNYIYATGWAKTDLDTFQVYYSGGDSYVGVAEIKVTYSV
jgi:predicted GH43/DUF377 family glycosyl hydrolase